ncbi:hypothetical protein B9Z55_013046 [Caenorhabditis nigoni]|uniref:UPAR/Ly6 domain-containing protein n=2 Tax=Caenorhabditis nigoni TaxID=1611254 RepID=A0A2G5U066_9PELO|nr:hypothetical protein B9Z55_013046 [Caenorhabditis nigoni]
MFCKFCILFALMSTVFSLQCAFEVTSAVSELNIRGAVDKCQLDDHYCITLTNVNGIPGIYATGCSLTAKKITGFGMPVPQIGCFEQGCNFDETVCCCTGDMCNL